MFLSGPWSKVFALNAQTGKMIWTYDPEVPGKVGERLCCDVVNRGLALYKGRVFVGTLDGRLISLDAATGKPVWQVLSRWTPLKATLLQELQELLKGM
jgi:glucose dehydrogenase